MHINIHKTMRSSQILHPRPILSSFAIRTLTLIKIIQKLIITQKTSAWLRLKYLSSSIKRHKFYKQHKGIKALINFCTKDYFATFERLKQHCIEG
mmetsp:Transcript_27376/g.5043  ORF Transcript_27376/g.5043 Transcript_27376/m.5043 type:complete len:95 (-) Transcript_27376:32-316(-)